MNSKALRSLCSGDMFSGNSGINSFKFYNSILHVPSSSRGVTTLPFSMLIGGCSVKERLHQLSRMCRRISPLCSAEPTRIPTKRWTNRERSKCYATVGVFLNPGVHSLFSLKSVPIIHKTFFEVSDTNIEVIQQPMLEICKLCLKSSSLLLNSLLRPPPRVDYPVKASIKHRTLWVVNCGVMG